MVRDSKMSRTPRAAQALTPAHTFNCCAVFKQDAATAAAATGAPPHTHSASAHRTNSFRPTKRVARGRRRRRRWPCNQCLTQIKALICACVCFKSTPTRVCGTPMALPRSGGIWANFEVYYIGRAHMISYIIYSKRVYISHILVYGFPEVVVGGSSRRAANPRLCHAIEYSCVRLLVSKLKSQASPGYLLACSLRPNHILQALGTHPPPSRAPPLGTRRHADAHTSMST